MNTSKHLFHSYLCKFSLVLMLGAFVGAHAADDRSIRFPDIPGYRTLKADFHQHTLFSDGKVWPNVRVEEGIRDGLDAMAVTEHLEWQPHLGDIPNPDRNRSYQIALQAASVPAGMSEGDYWIIEQLTNGNERQVRDQKVLNVRPTNALKEAKKQDILVFNGVEITRNNPYEGHESPLGHVNAIFIQDANRLLIDDPVEVLREAKRQGAFNTWNHPWLSGSYNRDGMVRLTDLHRQLLKENLLQGVEVANNDTYSEEAFQLALDYDLTIMSGSDIHGLVEWVFPVSDQMHRPTTLIFAKDKTAGSVKEALLNRRTAVWYKNTLIGRPAWIEPLIKASLQVTARGYTPDRKKFTIQIRPDTSLLEVEIKNLSDANFILSNVSPFRFYTESDVLTVPAHSSLVITVMTQQRVSEVELKFEVINAVIAPQKHPVVSFMLKTD